MTEIHFRCHDGHALFVGAEERYIVAKLVGCGTDKVRTARDAALHALAVTADNGFCDTLWFVYDRVTDTTHLFRQTYSALEEVDAA